MIIKYAQIPLSHVAVFRIDPIVLVKNILLY